MLGMQCVVNGTSHSTRRVGRACHAENAAEPQKLPNERIYNCQTMIGLGNLDFIIAAQLCNLSCFLSEFGVGIHGSMVLY